LINTPIIQSEDGSGLPNGYSASAFAFGINPEDDPELAMVRLRLWVFFLSRTVDFFRLFVFQWKNNDVYKKLKLVVVQLVKEANKTHRQTPEPQVRLILSFSFQ
jgi:hypothetical protein